MAGTSQKRRSGARWRELRLALPEQVWTFNRGPVPVQVYSADGELVRSWGQGEFREPHSGAH